MSVVKVAIANSQALRLVMCRRICAPPELNIRICDPLKIPIFKLKEKSEKRKIQMYCGIFWGVKGVRVVIANKLASS